MPGTIAQSVVVDIAKDTLEVHLHPAGRVRRFANDAQGCAALIAWLGDFTIARVAFEPSGASPRLRAPPGRGRPAAGQGQSAPGPPFRRSARRHAKTDVVDAAMLARFAALLEPPCGPSSARPSMP
jgi:transposase